MTAIDPRRFRCGHCGRRNTLDPAGRVRNSCVHCGWSKHTGFGHARWDEMWPPCDAMMKPYPAEPGHTLWRCQGCDYKLYAGNEATIDVVARAGTEREADVHWTDDTLYVTWKPKVPAAFARELVAA